MKTITAIGEALIDFISNDKDVKLKDATSFSKACGGAPANVCTVIAKLGGKAQLLTGVGNDSFGEFIIDELTKANVNTKSIKITSEAKTTLVFVSLDKNGNRDFSFYGNPGADTLFSESDINDGTLADTEILHFGSASLVDSPMKLAHKKAIKIAKDNNIIISFDPNIRLNLWNSESDCLSAVSEFLPFADIVKISDEEADFVTGKSNEEEQIEALFNLGAKMVFYTSGAKGARVITKNIDVFKNSIPVKATDTTGAGDAFMGSMLFCLLKNNYSYKNLEKISAEEAERFLDFAVKYSGISVTKKGASSSYVTYDNFQKELKKFFPHSIFR